jgi:dienelactone hydrolase
MKQTIRIQRFSLLLLLGVLGLFSATAQTHTPRYVSMSPYTKGYYEYLPEGYNPSGTATYPVILFLGGIGEFGNGSTTELPLILKFGIPKVIKDGKFPKSIVMNGETHRFIVISPQFIKDPRVQGPDLDAILNYIVSNYKVNTSRIYLTGMSYGGGLCWAYPGNKAAFASRIAAIVPIASAAPLGGDSAIYARSRTIAAANLPVWATHNSGDPSDPVATTNSYISYINQAPAPNPLAKKTIFTASYHDAWTRTYNTDTRANGYNVYEWMLLHRKGFAPPPSNVAPTANAGADRIITLPTNSVTLTGSGADSDGGITGYSWTKTSGPASGTITSPTAASTTITNLVQGIYIFRLTVTDTKSGRAFDEVKVTVNQGTTTGGKSIQVDIFGGTNPVAGWNNWNVGTVAATNKTISALKFTDGTTSTVGATLSDTRAVNDNGSTYGSGMAPAGVLRYASNSTILRTLTISGLSTTKKYNLELYASRNYSTAGSTVFSVNGLSATINAVNNLSNKASFTNLTPNASGQLVVSINKTATYNYLNGFTLTELAGTSSITSSGVIATEPMVEASFPVRENTEAYGVFPNPANSSFVLRVNNEYNGALRVQVVDVAGRSQKEFRLVKNQPVLQQTLSVSELPKGVYFVTTQMGGQRQTVKLSKF